MWGFVHKCLLFTGGKGIKESKNKKKTNTAQNKEKCET